MSWVDYAFLFIIAISVVVSLMRGFVRESLSLAGWVVSFWLATSFSSPLSELLLPYIETASLRLIVAFIALFVITMMLATAASNLVVQLVERAGLSSTDRAIGIFFGIARGVVIIVAIIFVAGLTPIPQDSWWKESFFIPYFQGIAVWVQGFLPEHITTKFIY